MGYASYDRPIFNMFFICHFEMELEIGEKKRQIKLEIDVISCDLIRIGADST